MKDYISHAFEEMRKRSPNPPRLDRPSPKMRELTRAKVVVPGLEPPARFPRKQKGMETGPDGYRKLPSRNIPSLATVLSKTIRSENWETGFANGWLMGHWEDIVGEKIAQHTTIDRIEDGIIYVECDSTAWKTNLTYMQREILRKIAAELGPDNFTQIKIFVPNIPSWRKGPLHVKGRGPRDTYG